MHVVGQATKPPYMQTIAKTEFCVAGIAQRRFAVALYNSGCLWTTLVDY